MLIFCIIIIVLHYFVDWDIKSYITFEILLDLILFFRLWILIIIKKLSSFQKQEKILSHEKGNLKLLNVMAWKYFGSGLVIAIGGYLS